LLLLGDFWRFEEGRMLVENGRVAVEMEGGSGGEREGKIIRLGKGPL
jgi:hypothetical protein